MREEKTFIFPFENYKVSLEAEYVFYKTMQTPSQHVFKGTLMQIWKSPYIF